MMPVVLTILFRNKYPRWWFDFNLQLVRFSTRVLSYLALMSDRYPSTDEEQSVHLDLDYPNVDGDLNRWLPLVKWLLAIPHYIVLFFLGVAVVGAVVIAWFAVLFNGRYPRGAFDFVEGVLRLGLRVQAYAFLLVTDRYPPFRCRLRTTGVDRDRAIGGLDQVEAVEQFGHAPVALVPVEVLEGGHQPQVLGAREQLIDGRGLAGNADGPPHRVGFDGEVVAADTGRAAVPRSGWSVR